MSLDCEYILQKNSLNAEYNSYTNVTTVWLDEDFQLVGAVDLLSLIGFAVILLLVIMILVGMKELYHTEIKEQKQIKLRAIYGLTVSQDILQHLNDNTLWNEPINTLILEYAGIPFADRKNFILKNNEVWHWQLHGIKLSLLICFGLMLSYYSFYSTLYHLHNSNASYLETECNFYWFNQTEVTMDKLCTTDTAKYIQDYEFYVKTDSSDRWDIENCYVNKSSLSVRTPLGWCSACNCTRCGKCCRCKEPEEKNACPCICWCCYHLGMTMSGDCCSCCVYFWCCLTGWTSLFMVCSSPFILIGELKQYKFKFVEKKGEGNQKYSYAEIKDQSDQPIFI